MPIFTKTPQPYDLSNMSIMIVEDSQYLQDLTTQMLKIFGVGEIMACSGGQEAQDILSVIQASRRSKYLKSIDIILTDWLMPKGSGKDLLQWIRGHERDSIRFLPVIVISGYTTELVASTARDLGAHETMVKPISGSALAGRICSVIDHPRPFIKSASFFGPDRRRQDIAYKDTDRRVTKAEEIMVKHANPE